MSGTIDSLSRIQGLADKLKDISMPTMPDESILYQFKPELPKIEIDEKSTFAYQMQQQTNQILEKSNEQIRLLTEHNERLESNYKKLEELYKLKERELVEAKQETRKTKRMSIAMLVVAIISMLVASAAWASPLLIGGVA
ncbi:hypothetical protein [Hespellia stercorisuis]|uniref:Uncharacterized protein n=1 Tax=Hespellia stercorisuis DSM 15480 TaxID=1121950 RepID=A0A1M6PPG6_9FIRM|nr:hypothetical protein [Hespellia stercorisuis]SHK09819.1 hypothetical protein SAMN02745243_02183 [Hespellia stercorisuis DSM 15480]